jgi:putative ABC transport system permease protein
VKPTDGLTFAAVAVALIATALAASFLPARRASRIQPVTALRWE